jgi:formylglycine-generating enzyme required for sulfatase activity
MEMEPRVTVPRRASLLSDRTLDPLVAIPAGWFWMGSDTGPPAERPRHRVWVAAFAIGPHPVTNGEYAAFVRATGTRPAPFATDPRFADSRQPVVGVSWDEAVAYCAWLTRATGRPHRLPTEAEWERAARGGLDDLRYPWGDAAPESCFPEASLPLPGPPVVGGGPANGFGLRDLSGVVHEWCLDWHADDYYRYAPPRQPLGPAGGRRRASRGGAWRHQRPWSPVAHRSSLPPHLRYSDYGFRVVGAA